MLHIPMFERGGIDLYNTIFHQSFCSNQLVIRGVVNHINDFSFFGNLTTNKNKKQYNIFLICRCIPRKAPNPHFMKLPLRLQNWSFLLAVWEPWIWSFLLWLWCVWLSSRPVWCWRALSHSRTVSSSCGSAYDHQSLDVYDVNLVIFPWKHFG